MRRDRVRGILGYAAQTIRPSSRGWTNRRRRLSAAYELLTYLSGWRSLLASNLGGTTRRMGGFILS
jgi:hypothetical protein